MPVYCPNRGAIHLFSDYKERLVSVTRVTNTEKRKLNQEKQCGGGEMPSERSNHNREYFQKKYGVLIPFTNSQLLHITSQ